jgi:succinoglycan biosynthesis transport protein ExoP
MPETHTSPADTLQWIAGVVVRGRWWVLLSACVVVLATVGVVYRIPNSYTSEATLIVVPQQIPSRYVTPTSETSIADALPAMTQDVLSRTRLLGLMDEFGLYRKERTRLAPEEVIELMRRYIQIRPIDPTPGHKDINSFKISFVAERAALAQAVTSRLTSFFIQANLKTREDQATNTTNFLRDQLERARVRLEAQEAKVRDFKTQYLGELPQQEQGNLAIFNGAQSQLQNIENSLDRAQQQQVYLQSLLSGYQRLEARGVPTPGLSGPAPTKPQSPLQAAQTELVRLEAEKDTLLDLYKPGYPDVVAIDRQISTMRARVERLAASSDLRVAEVRSSPGTAPLKADPSDDASITQIKSQLASNRLDIENLTKYEAQQKALIAQYQNRLNLTPVREEQLAGILRDYELSKQDYTDLLGKEQQSQLATSLEKEQEGQQFRLVEPPSLPGLPSSPKRIKLSLGGLGAGLFLGLIFAFLKEVARPTFHTTREVSRRYNAPLVIGLPVVLTPAEERHRHWIKAVELVCGSAVALVICIAQLYVVWHP